MRKSAVVEEAVFALLVTALKSRCLIIDTVSCCDDVDDPRQVALATKTIKLLYARRTGYISSQRSPYGMPIASSEGNAVEQRHVTTSELALLWAQEPRR